MRIELPRWKNQRTIDSLSKHNNKCTTRNIYYFFWHKSSNQKQKLKSSMQVYDAQIHSPIHFILIFSVLWMCARRNTRIPKHSEAASSTCLRRWTLCDDNLHFMCQNIENINYSSVMRQVTTAMANKMETSITWTVWCEPLSDIFFLICCFRCLTDRQKKYQFIARYNLSFWFWSAKRKFGTDWYVQVHWMESIRRVG